LRDGEDSMLDLLMLAFGGVLFAAALGYVALCERI
jgi:hypothetical protein